jgi:hypothetical protein
MCRESGSYLEGLFLAPLALSSASPDFIQSEVFLLLRLGAQLLGFLLTI